MEPTSIQQSTTVNQPTALTKFLWWLATADEQILKSCTIDRNRYSIIGMSVLATWLFASLAWTYFFYTVTASILSALLPALFMGFIILTIDRALIKGISAGNKSKIFPFLFRAILAVSIGSFMAQPAVLYIFNKEITMQVSIDNEARKLNKRQQAEAVYTSRKTTLQQEQQNLNEQLNTSLKAVKDAQQNYLAEADGSGGSGLRGIKNIAIAKRNEYYKLDTAYQQLQLRLRPQIDSIENQLAGIEQIIRNDEKQFAGFLNEGFLVQSTALNNLLKESNALKLRYYLIVFILVLIELMPVIAKTLLPTGTYDEKSKLIEEMEKNLAEKNIERQQGLKEFFNQQAFENDRKTIDEVFDQHAILRKDKIADIAGQWKTNESTSFNNVWQSVKKNIFSQQEE